MLKFSHSTNAHTHECFVLTVAFDKQNEIIYIVSKTKNLSKKKKCFFYQNVILIQYIHALS